MKLKTNKDFTKGARKKIKNKDQLEKKYMSNWIWWTKSKTNKISIKIPRKKIKIKRIRTETWNTNKKREDQAILFEGEERKKEKERLISD
jgi:hypothetical protein